MQDFKLSYYEQITKASTKLEFNKAVIRLVGRVLLKVRLPKDVREDFCTDIYEIHLELFGNDYSDQLVNTLSTYYMQDDTRGALSGENKHAACSNFEYSFYSDRTERRIRADEYFREESIGGLTIHTKGDTGGVPEVEAAWNTLLQISKAGEINPEGLEFLKLNAVEGYTIREISKEFSNYSKTKVGSIMKDVKDSLKNSIK